MFPESQTNSGSLSRRPVDPAQRLLRITYPVDRALVQSGANTIRVAVLHQVPHILRQYRIEKVELFLS